MYIYIITLATQYTFKLYSVNCGFTSDPTSLTTYSASVPDKIKSVSLLQIIDNQSLSIIWSNNHYNGGMPITSYIVYSNNSVIATLTTLNMQYTINSLALGTSYKFTVTSTNVIGESVASDPYNIVFSNPPSSPLNYTIKSTIPSVIFKWSAPTSTNGDSLLGYRIYIDKGQNTTGGNIYSLIYDTDKESGIFEYAYFTDSLKLNTIYFTYITAYNSAGESIPTTGIFTYGESPSSPYALSINSMIAGTSILLNFKPPQNTGGIPITGYILNKDGIDLATVILPSATSLSDDITGTVIGDTIDYKIKAQNQIGDSDYSTILSVIVGSVPNPPLNLSIASRISSNSIILQWDLETPIANNYNTLGYSLTISDNANNIFSTQNTIASTISNYYTLTNLIIGRSYSVTVKSINILGESGDSNILNFTAGSKPGIVNNIISDIYNTDTTKITVKFSPPNSNGGSLITQYLIYYDIGITGTFTKYTLTGLSVLGYAISSLSAGDKVNVKITAENNIGEGDYNEVYQFLAATVSDPPTTITTNNYSAIGNIITMQANWIAPVYTGGINLTYYKIYLDKQDPNNQDDFVLISDSISIWNNSYMLYNLQKGVYYTIKIIATNKIGDSIPAIYTFITADKPSSPLDLKVDIAASGVIDISWIQPKSDGGSVLTSYNIYYRKQGDVADTVTTTSNILLKKSLTGLVADDKYTIYVTASNAQGEGIASNVITTYSSSAPSSLTAPIKDDTNRTYNSISISWSVPTSTIPILGYEVYIDNGNNTIPNRLAYSGKYISNITKTTIKKLNSGTFYNIAFIAFNEAGASDLSPILKVLIGKYPNTPTNITLVKSTSTSIEITWKSPSDLGGLRLQSYKLYLDAGVPVTISNNLNSYAFSSLTNGNSYSIEISAVNDLGEGPKSLPVSYKALDLPTPPTISLTSSSSYYCSIEWTAVTPPNFSNILGYRIYIDDGKNGNIKMVYDGSNNAGILSYNISNLLPNSAYQIYGSSINEAGEGIKSTSVQCKTVPIPGQPGQINLVTSSSSNIEVLWTPPIVTYQQISGYNLYFQLNSGISGPTVQTWNLIYSGLNTSYDLNSGLTPTKLYNFKVHAIDSNNREGPASSIASFYATTLPPQITGVTLSNMSKTGIKVDWTIPTLTANDITIHGYNIFIQNVNEGSDYTLLNVIQSMNVNSYQVGNLITGNKYNFKVSAYNGVGEGLLSNVESITCKYIPATPNPPILVSITSTSVSLADVVLKWAPISDTGGVALTGYYIDMKDLLTTTISSKIYDGTNIPSVLTTTINNLTIGKSYEFTLVAMNPEESLPSIPLDILIAEKPSQITSISVQSGSRTRNSIGLTWNAPVDGGSAIISYTLIDSITSFILYKGTSTYYNLTNLSQGSIVSVIVLATNKLGDSESSDIYQFLIYGNPDPPVNLSVLSSAQDKINLNWYLPVNNGGSDILSYNIYREDISNNIARSLISTNSATLLNYMDITVSAGVQYRYYITSINTNGESSMSTSIESTAMSLPDQMITVKPTLVSSDISSITISWTAVPDNGGDPNLIYNLYYKKSSDNIYILAYSGNNLSTNIKYLQAGSYYTFKLQAKNSIGLSDWSQESDQLLCGTIPSEPLNLSLTSRDENNISFSWQKPNVVGTNILSGYNVYTSTDGINFNEDLTALSKNNPNIMLYSISSLTAGNYYYFSVTARNGKGESKNSKILTVITGTVPKQPTDPLVFTTSILNSSILVQITTLPLILNGGSSITGYVVKMDDGKGGSFNTISDSLQQSFTIDNLSIGNTYRFKYAARNAIYDKNNLLGSNLVFSPIYSILLADKPSIVLNLKSISQYPDKIMIQWDSPIYNGGSVILYYNLVMEDITNSAITNTKITSDTNSYLFTSLIPGNIYEFNVNAQNSTGTGPNSQILRVTAGLLPIQMSIPTISSVTKNSISVNWSILFGTDTGGTVSDPLTITNYILYMRNKTMNDSFITIFSSNSATSYTISGLIAGNNYEFRIAATNIIGQGIVSDVINATPATYPNSPYNLLVTDQNKDIVYLNWSASTDNGGLPILYYELEILKSGSATPINLNSIDTNFIFNISNGLISGSEYSIKIRAHNLLTITTNTNPNWSNSISAFSSYLPNNISISVSSITRTDANINWNSISTLVDTGYTTIPIVYILEMDNGGDNIFKEIYRTTSGNIYNVVIPYVGKSYNFRMRTMNNIGYSKYSNILTVLFGEVPSKPSIPQLISRSASSLSGGTPYISLKWTYPSDNGGIPVKGYKIEMSTTGTFPGTIVYNKLDTTITQFTITNLTAGQMYHFIVYANNEIGYSIASDPLSVIAGTVPIIMNSLSYASSTKTSITVNWTVPSSIESTGGSTIIGYKIKINAGNNSQMYTETDINNPSITTYTFNTLITGVTYDMKIAAYNIIYSSNYFSLADELKYSDKLSIPAAIEPSQILSFYQDINKLTQGQINLAWQTPSDNGGILIFAYILMKESIPASGNYQIIYQGMTTTYSDINLGIGATYNYKVYAVNMIGRGLDSNIITGYAGTFPGKISSIVIQSVSSTSFTLSWTAPTQGGLPITAYYILSNSPVSTYATAPVNNGLNITYTLAVAIGDIGKSFNFKIFAANILGDGPKSQEITVYPCDAPGVPTFTVISRNLTGFTISYSANASTGGCSITGYQLYMDSGISGTPLTLVYNGLRTPQINQFIFSNLQTNLSYNVKVEYYNQAGLSNSYTDSVLVGTIPSPPKGLQIQSVDNTGNLSITWVDGESGGLPISSYEIFIDDGSGTYPATGITYTDTNNLIYSFTSLTLGNTYKVKIKSTNALGDSKFSEEIYITIASPPDAPTNLILDNASINSISVSWTPPVNNNGASILGYKLYMYDQGNYLIVYNGIGNSANVSYTVSNLQTGITYKLQVTAINAAGEGNPSTLESFICADLPLAPGKPYLISSSTTNIKLGWQFPQSDGGSEILLYEIWEKTITDNESTWALLGTTDISTLSYNHSGLSTLTDYQYMIRAKTVRGYSSYSSRATFPLGSVPTVNNPPTKIAKTVSSIKISFKETNINGSGILGYQLFIRNISKQGVYSLIYDGSNLPLITTYTVYNLNQGDIYTFKFIAINRVGTSDYSPDSISITCAEVPEQPQSPIVTKTTSTTIEFKLNINVNSRGSPIKKYKLFRDDGSITTTFSEIMSYNNIDTTFTLDQSIETALITGTIYRFIYIAENEEGDSIPSNEIKVALASLPPQTDKPAINYPASTATQLKIEWNSITATLDMPLVKYSLWMDDGSGGNYVNVCNVNMPSSATQFCYINTIKGRLYRFYTNATNFNGVGLSSDIYTSYSCSNPSLLYTPTYVSSTQTSIKIAWKAPEENGGCEITGYELYRDDADNTIPYIRIDQVLTENNPTLNIYEITGLTNIGLVYQFMIKTKNSIDAYTQSDLLSVVLAALPAKPSNIPTRDDSNTSQNYIIIEISAFTGNPNTGGSSIISYELKRDDGDGNGYQTLYGMDVFSLSTNYNDSKIVLGKEYKYIYRARNVNGWGEYSDPALIKAVVKPNTPNKIGMISASSTQIIIQIYPLSDYKGSVTVEYEINIDSGVLNSSFSGLAGYNGTDSSYTISTGITPGNTYSFIIRAKNQENMYSEYRYIYLLNLVI